MSITFMINGRTLTGERGQTVLQVAQANDIYIPTLCHYPGLPPHGSCRMCIVEVKDRPNTPTACTTPIEEGMVVETDTPQIRELRNEIIRMLLADHTGSCLFCPENEDCEECMVTLRKTGVTTGCRTCPADRQCEIQEIVSRSGLQSVAYPVRYRGLRVEKEDPFFDRDYNLCVLCGRCIRVCESIHFNNIPTYLKRGSTTRIGTSFGQTHLEAGCSFCGACVDACPTGALWEKTRKWDGRAEFEVQSTCTFCSLGCDTRLLAKKNGKGMIISHLPGEIGRSLCVKGRFGVVETVNHPSRLKEVLSTVQGETTRSNWDVVIRQAANRLSECRAGDFAMVVSASCSNEDLFIAKKFAREVMGAAPILNASARYGKGLAAVSRLLAVSQALEALDTSDLIFSLGLDIKYAQSVVEVRLKRAIERGAKVITLHTADHVPGRFASLWLQPEPGKEIDMLNRLANDQAEGDESEAIQWLRSAEKPVLLVGPDFLARMPDAVERLYKESGADLVAIPAEGNLGGALRIGLAVVPECDPPKALYLMGTSVPVGLDSNTYVLYQNTHTAQIEPGNGVMLPMAAIGEAEGSIVDQSGKVKHLSKAVAPAGNALPGWEILCRIARAMGKPGFNFASVYEISAEMANMPEDWPCEVNLSPWVNAPGEHDFLGADLSRWVAGLSVLAQAQCEEGQHV